MPPTGPESQQGCAAPPAVLSVVQDVLIQGEGGAQILVEPGLVDHFEASLTKVRTVPVETRGVPLSQLRVAPPKREETNSIEASLRLDAVGSAGKVLSWWLPAEPVVHLMLAGDCCYLCRASLGE
eukprot:GHUV01051937.1.p1 GENE.GHUV01051937.1~~GHUV01051937.1.p1  ORF type:complete len:125 (-),score=20.26 GHUV01051937.1:394-768(-)